MQISLTKLITNNDAQNQDRIPAKRNPQQNNWRIYSQNQQWNPPTDVFETEEEVVIRIEIAGMEESAFDILFDKNLLTITGKRFDPFANIRVFHQMEVGFGEFLTAVEINIPLDLDTSSATYENGYLIIQVHKAKPKSIKVDK